MLFDYLDQPFRFTRFTQNRLGLGDSRARVSAGDDDHGSTSELRIRSQFLQHHVPAQSGKVQIEHD